MSALGRPFRFLSVGVLNTVVGYAVIAALIAVGANDVTANFTGYLVGLLLSYTLNRKWTFNDRGRWLERLPRFVITFLLSYGANLYVVLRLIEVGIDRYLAHLSGIGIYTVLTYCGSLYFVFRENSAHTNRQH